MVEPCKNNYSKLLYSIFELLRNQGLKKVTMDQVAKSLGMSKRTLYELFGSKDNMLISVIEYLMRLYMERAEEVFRTSPDMMTAMLKIFSIHLSFLTSVNARFFKDLDSMYPEIRQRYNCSQKDAEEGILSVMKKGVQEHVFRKGLNYPLLVRLMNIQFESLKRIEELFPADLTLAEAFMTISVSFLRSIATPKGMKIVDSYSMSVPSEGFILKNE